MVIDTISVQRAKSLLPIEVTESGMVTRPLIKSGSNRQPARTGDTAAAASTTPAKSARQVRDIIPSLHKTSAGTERRAVSR
jgi:hypothetical protein